MKKIIIIGTVLIMSIGIITTFIMINFSSKPINNKIESPKDIPVINSDEIEDNQEEVLPLENETNNNSNVNNNSNNQNKNNSSNNNSQNNIKSNSNSNQNNTTTPTNPPSIDEPKETIDYELIEKQKQVQYTDFATCTHHAIVDYAGDLTVKNTSCDEIIHKGVLLGYRIIVFYW